MAARPAREAEQAFASSVAGWREAGQLTMTAWGGYHWLVQRAQGRLDAAVRTCEQALDSPAPGPPLPAAGTRLRRLAEVAYQRNELDAALRHVTEGIALCRQFVYTPPLATAWPPWPGSGRPRVTRPGHWRR